ncbi:ketosteroid isomerase-related protein [Consotaella aegiceratis]|uniref:ketosteroid isomerase-related protein n=1 Tax=Consotaella aegiceratis TaxID=3097961 RepID=UPI002F3EDE18
MSEQASGELVRAYVEAFNASDWSGLIGLLDGDVAYDPGEGGRQIGPRAFRDALAHRARFFRERMEDVVVFTAEGGTRAAIEFTLRGDYLSTHDGLPEAEGQRYAVPAAQFFEIDDGRISRVTTYLDQAALRAALAGR